MEETQETRPRFEIRKQIEVSPRGPHHEAIDRGFSIKINLESKLRWETHLDIDLEMRCAG